MGCRQSKADLLNGGSEDMDQETQTKLHHDNVPKSNHSVKKQSYTPQLDKDVDQTNIGRVYTKSGVNNKLSGNCVHSPGNNSEPQGNVAQFAGNQNDSKGYQHVDTSDPSTTTTTTPTATATPCSAKKSPVKQLKLSSNLTTSPRHVNNKSSGNHHNNSLCDCAKPQDTNSNASLGSSNTQQNSLLLNYQNYQSYLRSPGCSSINKPPPLGVDMSDENFTQQQKTLLRETWSTINGENHGIAIFFLIFERKPSAKTVFPFRDLEGEALQSNPSFLAHARRFMCAISSTIDNLDALEVALIPTLARLGEIHGWIPGFSDEFLPVFITAIIDVITDNIGEKCTEEVREAWMHLGKLISDKLDEGYLKKQKERSSQNLTLDRRSNGKEHV